MSARSTRAVARLADPIREMARLVQQIAHRHRPGQVFSDFCELAASAISNAVDKSQAEKREERYMQLIGSYNESERSMFPQMLGLLVQALEARFDDCLGRLFMSMDLGNAQQGQFFTPYSVSQLMAGMTMTDAASVIERQGFIQMNEPAVGAGGMVIATAEALMNQKINYQQCMHVTAVDVDPTAVHMAYLQFSLLHIPAIVVHGNSLSLEEWGHWVTPAHVLGGWDRRLAMGRMVNMMRAYLEQPETAETGVNPQGQEQGGPGGPQAPDADAPALVRARVVAARLEQMDLFG